MLLGTVLLSMVSGQITAYLTSFQVAETFSIQGKDVAVPLGMQNFLEKELNLGAKYKEYATKDIMLAVQYHNNSRIDGRNYAVFHDYEKLQTWVLERNLSVTFKVKMTISHRLYLGVVITHIPETAKGFFECLKTVVSDKIAIKKLVERARFRNELNQVSTASQTSTNLETTSLQYLGIAVGIIIAIGLMWELFWRLKNKKSSAVPHPD
ncbi:uncharacterized protein LOC110246535 [Exaiptasia diaphana]|uniref:Uncharacterized protein n=1 Tax=Exaiptasia diaphana TaxID=2652724 RepID=A0A913XSI9_EXADI|nr:uncharacterized protein LOC110246535 [Exaiptasia diaphana]